MIELEYKCHCMLAPQKVRVRYREPGEDILTYMEGVVRKGLGDDHRGRSPNCRATEMEYAKIPFSAGSDFIGGPPVS